MCAKPSARECRTDHPTHPRARSASLQRQPPAPAVSAITTRITTLITTRISTLVTCPQSALATPLSRSYFENVCELDIMFNLEKAHFILDEMVMNGCIIETNKNNILAPVHLLDKAGPT